MPGSPAYKRRATRCCCPEPYRRGIIVPRRYRETVEFVLDKQVPGAYNARQSEKPMSQSSNRKGSLSESRGRWDRGRKLLVNGLARAERTYRQVATDGGRTRYPGGAYEVRESERAHCVNLGGTAGWKSCPKYGIGLFLLPENGEYGRNGHENSQKTMAVRDRLRVPAACNPLY